MKRRDFIKNISAAAAVPLLINNIPLHALAANSPLMQMLGSANGNDKILVLLQLHGGNDGLNTLIPISQYSNYYNIRANIAIPETGSRQYIALDDSIDADSQIGLHPDMGDVQQLYDKGMASFVQNVGYENTNMSHFRGRDIYYMGGDYNETFNSSWMGRFLEHEFPGYPDSFPNDNMPDPLGLELGNTMSLAFHRSSGIPAGISIANPSAFYNLISQVGITPPTVFPDNHHGEELKYLMDFEIKTNQYAQRLKQVYDAGSNQVDYPTKYPYNAPYRYVDNELSPQMQIISRLISGGSKTRLYVARIGEFDTHAEQVESYDTTLGGHAALLHHVSTAVKAFFDDLEKQGLADRVLVMTFSEFGRRAYSNGSYGTDHGKAAPVMLFGPGLKGGVYGKNPDLDNLDGGNLRWQIDYRQVYASVLQDWLGADAQAMEASYFGEYIDQRLDLFGTTSVNRSYTPKQQILSDCAPNPAHTSTRISYFVPRQANVQLNVYTSGGRLVRQLHNGSLPAGNYDHTLNVGAWSKGAYLYRLKVDNQVYMKKLIVK